MAEGGATDYSEILESVEHERKSAEDLLSAIEEVFQVLLFSSNLHVDKDEKIDPKLKVAIKQGDQEQSSDVHLFKVKVSCNQSVDLVQALQAKEMPSLCSFVCALQKDSGKSHLAIQTSEGDASDELSATIILWLEELDTNALQVKVANKIVKPAREIDNWFVVIQIRVLLDPSSLLKFSKEMCLLMEMIKFLNPEMQLSFTLDFGNVVDLDLREPERVDLKGIALCPNVFERKFADYYQYEACDIQCSDAYTLTDGGQSGYISSLSLALRCILLYIPMCRESPLNMNKGLLYKKNRGTTPGAIYLLFYGPHGIPLMNNQFAKNLMKQRDSFLHLSNFGIHFKETPAKLSKFSVEMRAEMQSGVAARDTGCQRFCLVFAYILEHAEKIVSHKDFLSVHKSISENFSTMVHIDLMRQCTESAVAKMFGPTDAADICLVDNGNDQIKAPSHSSYFEKMIPDIVDSLTDIFTRSTNIHFRAQISILVPTSSRAVMSDHLEKALKKTINAPILQSIQTPSPEADEIEESVDEWGESQESMLSQPKFQPQSFSEDLTFQCVNYNTNATFADLSSRDVVNEYNGRESTDPFREEDLNIELLFRESTAKAENDLESWRLLAHADCQKFYEQDTILQGEYPANHECSDLCLESIPQSMSHRFCHEEECIEQDNEKNCNLLNSIEFTKDMLSFNEDDALFNLKFQSQGMKNFAHSPPNADGFVSYPLPHSIQCEERESFEQFNFENDLEEQLSFQDHSQSEESCRQKSFTRKRSSEFLEFSDHRIQDPVTASDDMTSSQVPFKQLRIQQGDHCLSGEYLRDQSFAQFESFNCFLDENCIAIRASNTEEKIFLTPSSANTSNISESPPRHYEKDSEWFDEEEITLWKAEMES